MGKAARKVEATELRKLTAREWEYFKRGYDVGQFFAREDTATSRPREDRLLRVREVMKLNGLGRTTIWQLEREGRFPKRRKLAGSRGRAVAWLASEVARWIARRMAAREA